MQNQTLDDMVRSKVRTALSLRLGAAETEITAKVNQAVDAAIAKAIAEIGNSPAAPSSPPASSGG